MKVLCITIPELPGEEATAKAHFDSVGLSVEFVHGIHGVKSGIDSTLPYEFDNPGSGFKVGPKIISLALNHYIAWSICKALPDEMFLVLESDAKFEEDWKARLNQALLDIPEDWEVLMLGSCNCAGKPMEHIKGNIHRVDTSNPHHMPQCSQATLYRPSAIKTILETQRKFYTGIDLALIFHSFPLLKLYAYLPRLVDQFGIVIEP